MPNLAAVDKTLPRILIATTAVTGLIDAVSFLSLGRVFTANMTGNVVLLAFASTGTPEVSVARSATALIAFLVGAALGGRIMARTRADSPIWLAAFVFALEAALLIAATFCALGYTAVSSRYSLQLYTVIVLTAIAMGMRNATVRKLGVPELTTTVLTMTLTGLAADSSVAHGNNPRWQRRIAAVLAMFAGAALGALVIRRSVSLALALAAGASLLCVLRLLLALRSPSTETQLRN